MLSLVIRESKPVQISSFFEEERSPRITDRQNGQGLNIFGFGMHQDNRSCLVGSSIALLAFLAQRKKSAHLTKNAANPINGLSSFRPTGA